MKYNNSNKPLICMQTQSDCYKGTTKMTIKGILWHSTGANNPTLKRYVQPSDVKPAEDTYTKDKWIQILGKNAYNNDYNHSSSSVGLNAWIGNLADGTVTAIQTLPWDYKPWGCYFGAKGSCNDGWIQFEICEDGLTDSNYFNAIYKEACELTAYLCNLYGIDPNGTVTVNGVNVPTITCHQDAAKLGFASNHVDVNHWFPKYGKSMATARADVSTLLKTIVPTTPTTVKTYKLITEVNTYPTAADAKAQKNAKSKYAAGTYYIYNKYPNGVDGMYNISTDKTGASAGSWINPSENVIKETVKEDTTAQKLYRVRKSWSDASSQKGAFTNLDGAKTCCQSAGAGYHVFDWDGKIVYSYVAPTPTPTPAPESESKPEETKQETTVVAVYDLDYPEKNKIVDRTISRTNADCVKAIQKILSNNPSFDVEIAKKFFEIAPVYGIDPMMAISQSILETGWFKYAGSAVKPEQHNYCGLGVTSNGITGASFDTIDDGVTAQLQHLYAYGCKDALPTGDKVLDPRFTLVTRGIAPYWQQLAGRWACPGYDKSTYSTPEDAMKNGNTYGQKIRAVYNQIATTIISDEDIEKYFQKEQPAPIDPEGSDDTNDDELKDNINFVFSWLRKIIEALINVFKKG